MAMMRRFVIATLACVAVGCARTELVAEGPLALSTTPLEVPFSHPVTAPGPERELCFEFYLPGESRNAGRIRATLITTEGRRDELRAPKVDRRGESLVCLSSREEASGAAATPVRYRAAELSSDVPVKLRQIRWWSGGPQ
jgi:hypothetical protein